MKIKANCDVAVEFFILNFIRIIKQGTKIIPPPTPKLLEIIPAIKDKDIKTTNLKFWIDSRSKLRLN